MKQAEIDARLDEIAAEAGLERCLECGKCTSVCPMGDLYRDFGFDVSPRGIVERARRDRRILYSAAIWQCLECEECTRACVSQIGFRGFMRKLRDLARQCGVIPEGTACRRCGRIFLPGQAMRYIESKTAGLEKAREYLHLCPSCRTRVFARSHRKHF
jgi:heterodisulfide reductase subunit C